MKDLIHDNLFYVCTVIEFVARSTHNHVRDIINKLSDDDIIVFLWNKYVMNGLRIITFQMGIIIMYQLVVMLCHL